MATFDQGWGRDFAAGVGGGTGPCDVTTRPWPLSNRAARAMARDRIAVPRPEPARVARQVQERGETRPPGDAPSAVG
jgi:hypothetical protein